MKLQTI